MDTPAFSVHERIREIGMLRALWMTQPQLRAVVGYESLSVALFGTIVGGRA